MDGRTQKTRASRQSARPACRQRMTKKWSTTQHPLINRTVKRVSGSRSECRVRLTRGCGSPPDMLVAPGPWVGASSAREAFVLEDSRAELAPTDVLVRWAGRRTASADHLLRRCCRVVGWASAHQVVISQSTCCNANPHASFITTTPAAITAHASRRIGRNLSLSNTTPSSTANTTLVSRRAETNATGA